MTSFILELKNILVFSIASLVLAIILFILVYLISFTSKVEFEKSSAYECGFTPFSESRYRFEVQFFLIAVLFLLFDIEVVYLYPIITSITYFTVFNYIGLILFFIILMVGIIYEISRHVISVNSILQVNIRKNHDTETN